MLFLYYFLFFFFDRNLDSIQLNNIKFVEKSSIHLIRKKEKKRKEKEQEDMFSTCITPRFYQNYFTIFWYFFFFFFFLSLTYLLNTYSHDSRFFFAFCAVLNVWRFIFIWQALSYSVSEYIWFHITHTYDTARTWTHLWWPILNTNFF